MGGGGSLEHGNQQKCSGVFSHLGRKGASDGGRWSAGRQDLEEVSSLLQGLVRTPVSILGPVKSETAKARHEDPSLIEALGRVGYQWQALYSRGRSVPKESLAENQISFIMRSLSLKVFLIAPQLKYHLLMVQGP